MSLVKSFVGSIAPGVGQLKPYLPGKPVSELERELGIRNSIKLASNENPLGCSPAAAQAVRDVLGSLGRYPDGGGYELRGKLAERHGVEPRQVTLGNGSNDILDLIARVFLWPGRESLMSRFAFAVYPISSQAVGATLRIAEAQDFGHDPQAMLQLLGVDTGMVWIANPNNPTGTRLDAATLRDLLERIPPEVVVVVDEAYNEYVEAADHPDASTWLAEFPNLIVTRTFSKAYGLAALRLGYSLSHPDVADLLNRVRQPFNVNAAAQAAALAALDDQAFIERAVELNRAGMQQLIASCERLGLGYIPSAGNFLCIDLGRDATAVDQALLREGCITRPVANYGMPQHLRVSIGLEQENARFVDSLEKVLSEC